MKKAITLLAIICVAAMLLAGCQTEAPAEHTHTLVHNEAKAPTCVNNGIKEHWYCPECNGRFADEAATEVLTFADLEVEELGHIGGTATCTEQAVCERCGQPHGAANGHTWDDAEATAKNCTVCGIHVNADFAGGKGTAEEPYLIKNAQQLMNVTNFYDSYKYYKVADGVSEIDMTGYGKALLNGSFDGNGVKLVNLHTALFQQVGYQNTVADIKISNLDVTMNAIDGCALVRNIFNAGKTTFENVAVHGYIEGLYNMGSFFNYGTANCDGTGANYTVEFINATSDATLVCTGSTAGGFIGHTYEGKGNSFTMIVDGKSAFTGKILTTSGKGNLYFGTTSDYNNTNNHFIINGEEVKFNNGNVPAAANLAKISVIKPTAGETAYEVEKVEGATEFVVYLNAQVTAYDEEGYKIPNKAGMTWPLGHFGMDELADMGLITSAVIVNGTDHEYGYELADGKLTIYSGRSASYESGTIRLQVNQYNADGELLATGTLDGYTIEHDHTFVGGDCTTDAVCNCGTKQKAPGHAWKDATCTAAKTCSTCGATEGEALGHKDENGDYKCDNNCGTKVFPEDGTALTVAQALKIASVAGESYTTQKYYITGYIVSIANTQYGNMTIRDANGDELYLYGLYSADGKTRYDAMTTKPVKGDEITVYTVLGTYYSAPQAKNAWLDELVQHTEHTWADATCTAPKTCTICEATEGDPIDHVYVDGVCSCGREEGTTAVANAKLDFSSANNRTVYTTSQQVWEQNGVTLTNDKGSSTSNVGDYAGPARFYKSSKITIAAAGITKIQFTCNSSSYATSLKNSLTAASISGATVSVSGSVVTLTLAEAVDSVIFNLSDGQVRMDSLIVNP